MSNNLDWLYKARRPYWEESSPGKRYRVFRSIINSATNGEYTLEKVQERTGVTATAVRNVESGADLGVDYLEEVLSKLIPDLGITREQFDTDKKIRAPKASKAPPAQNPVKDAANAQKTTPAPSPSEGKKKSAKVPTKSSDELTIINHTLMTFVLIKKGNEMHILDDCAASLKREKGAIWVAPADDIGSGHKLLPRSTSLKES